MIENEKGTEKYPQCPLSTNSERHARKLHFPIKLPLHAGNAGDADHPVRNLPKNAGTSCAKDDADRATVGFVVANAAIASDKKAIVFLSRKERACRSRDMPTTSMRPASRLLTDLMKSFAEAPTTRR